MKVFSVEIDPLSKMDYHFVKIDDVVYLDAALFCVRETTRHKYKIDNSKSYSRLNRRDYRIQEEPDVPIDIQVEAVKFFRNRITFNKWRRK